MLQRGRPHQTDEFGVEVRAFDEVKLLDLDLVAVSQGVRSEPWR